MKGKSHTTKNLFDGGYTTRHSDGSKSVTFKNVLDDGYTTYHDDGSKTKTYPNVLNDGYTSYHESSENGGRAGWQSAGSSSNVGMVWLIGICLMFTALFFIFTRDTIGNRIWFPLITIVVTIVLTLILRKWINDAILACWMMTIIGFMLKWLLVMLLGTQVRPGDQAFTKYMAIFAFVAFAVVLFLVFCFMRLDCSEGIHIVYFFGYALALLVLPIIQSAYKITTPLDYILLGALAAFAAGVTVYRILKKD